MNKTTKILLTALSLSLGVISTQASAITTKGVIYYPEGGVHQLQEFLYGNDAKTTIYHKTGEVEQVQEFVNGKLRRITGYHKTGGVKAVINFVNNNKINERSL